MVLDTIFNGMFNPSELCILNSEKFERACKNAERLQMKLSTQLSREDYALVEDLTNELLNSCDAECKYFFQYGFSSGLILMQEAQEFVRAQAEKQPKTYDGVCG